MPRYFVQRRKAWVEDDEGWVEAVAEHIPTVCDHEPIDTGLVDQSGDPIMRAPNPMGFIWDE